MSMYMSLDMYMDMYTTWVHHARHPLAACTAGTASPRPSASRNRALGSAAGPDARYL